MRRINTVKISLELELVVAGDNDDTVPVSGQLSYSRFDPYALRLALSIDVDTEVEWVFARNLVHTGLFRPEGIGDVHVWTAWHRGQEYVMLMLTSPDGQALFRTPAAEMENFLGRTGGLVPEGEEDVSDALDAWLRKTLPRLP